MRYPISAVLRIGAVMAATIIAGKLLVHDGKPDLDGDQTAGLGKTKEFTFLALH